MKTPKIPEKFLPFSTKSNISATASKAFSTTFVSFIGVTHVLFLHVCPVFFYFIFLVNYKQF